VATWKETNIDTDIALNRLLTTCAEE